MLCTQCMACLSAGSTLGPPWWLAYEASSAGQITSDRSTCLSSTTSTGSAPCACTRRLRRASGRRGSGSKAGYCCRRGCAGCPGRGHQVPSSDQRLTPLFLVRSILLLIHTCHTAGCYMLEQELAWRSSMLLRLLDHDALSATEHRQGYSQTFSIYLLGITCTPEF
jgi:hypothetical protein